MKRIIHSAVLLGSVVAGAALAFLGPHTGSRLYAQNYSGFPTPSGRYYNPYASGPYGSYQQGIGNAFSQGSPNMFSRGLAPLPPPAYSSWPPTGPNLYQNRPYGGSFYARPMVGPSYDPFRNGRY
jgi:hypothetical protein